MARLTEANAEFELARVSWREVERYLARDTRLVFSLGATEEHAHLSLATDTVLAVEVARRASASERVFLAPPLNYGNSLWSAAYPGTLWLRPSTLTSVIGDLIRSAYRSGFRRMLLVSGHSGNDVVVAPLQPALAELRDLELDYFAWYRDPQVLELARRIRPDGLDHANWGERIPAARVADERLPQTPQEPPSFRLDYVLLRPSEVRHQSPAGMHGRIASIPDEEAAPLLDLAVALARERLQRLAA